MKRYLVFAGEDYYPLGGGADFVSAHDDEQEAILAAKKALGPEGGYRWAHVLDLEELGERERWGAQKLHEVEAS